MTGNVSLEQVEALAAQLSPSERLKLAARICQQLSDVPAEFSTLPKDNDRARQERLAEVDALLAELDAVADSIEGEFDAVEDLRRIRDERADRL
jgi:hypothetical protein